MLQPPLRLCVLAVWLATGGLARADASPWALPPEGRCDAGGGLASGVVDAPRAPLRSGDAIGLERLEVLRGYLPPAVWAERERLFFDGMRLEVGPCFRDYAPPRFFAEATLRLRGHARLVDGGGLEGHVAGLPFAPADIAPGAPDAGQKWAWNVAHRYRAGGFRGRFRILDAVGRRGRAEPFEGEIFRHQLGARADRAAEGYRVPDTGERQWAAGGRYRTPYDLRDFAWLQYRDRRSDTDPGRADELHVYVPAARKARRVPGGRLEGVYTPAAAVAVRYAADDDERGAGSRPVQVEPKRGGFEGLDLRPLLYAFRVVGVHDVVAPLNARRPAYPDDPDRSFGPYGLSWASDRWDLRRALVLEATAPGGAGFRLWVDLQTLHPLYYVAFDADGATVDVGGFAGRWSEDRSDYPARGVRVIDPAGASFINAGLGASWRRESWDLVSAPLPDRELRRAVSLRSLGR